MPPILLRLKKYSIGKTIGKGAEGIVKLCTDKSTGDRYVIKIFNADDDLDEHPTGRLSCHHSHTHLAIPHELCIIRLLVDDVHQHDHIIKLQDIVHENGSWYEVLEYCSKGDLVRTLDAHKGAVPEFDCQRIFKQIVSGLRYMHSRGVSHRDMKLENCLLDAFSQVKVTDFGKSVIYLDDNSDKIKFWEPVGTLAYMAPEVFYGRGYYGDEVDVWSAGVVLLTLLCGDIMWEKPDLDDEDFKWYANGHLFRSYTFSESLKDLLSKMLEIDPTKRITLDEVVKHPWFQVRSIRGVHTCFESRPGALIRTNSNSSSKSTEKKRSKHSSLREWWDKIRVSSKTKKKQQAAEQKAVRMLMRNCSQCDRMEKTSRENIALNKQSSLPPRELELRHDLKRASLVRHSSLDPQHRISQSTVAMEL
eukprot:Nk52_evm53s230 gene=Nk52_evmTU53s230